jgi:hypothetical protein
MFLQASGATRIKPSPATGQETPRCLERNNRSMRGTNVPKRVSRNYRPPDVRAVFVFSAPGAFRNERNAPMNTEVVSDSLHSQPPLFSGFPYLVTRLESAHYHFILLPAEKPIAQLQEFARTQAVVNDLPSCLVLGSDQCFYYASVAKDGPSDEPPRGGLIYFGRLQPVIPIPSSPELVHRYGSLAAFARRLNPASGIALGDLTKGGRDTSPEELTKLFGVRKNGVPRGLRRCRTCREWFGQCLDPAPQFSRKIMQVHCLCQNTNLCAACLKPLYERKLNANYFDLSDGAIWHVPGFSAFAHQCCCGVPSPKKLSAETLGLRDPANSGLGLGTFS